MQKRNLFSRLWKFFQSIYVYKYCSSVSLIVMEMIYRPYRDAQVLWPLQHRYKISRIILFFSSPRCSVLSAVLGYLISSKFTFKEIIYLHLLSVWLSGWLAAAINKIVTNIRCEINVSACIIIWKIQNQKYTLQIPHFLLLLLQWTQLYAWLFGGLLS